LGLLLVAGGLLLTAFGLFLLSGFFGFSSSSLTISGFSLAGLIFGAFSGLAFDFF